MQDIQLISRFNKEWRPADLKIKRAGGQTNRNYIVGFKSKKLFVRLPWERANVLDRSVEAKNVFALSRSKKLKDILPEYYVYIYKGKNVLKPEEKDVFNLPDGSMMTEYIKGKDVDGKELKKTKIQNALVETIYAFHSSGVKLSNVYDVFKNELLKYKRNVKKQLIWKLISRRRLKKIETIEKEVKKSFPKSSGVSTHNDLIFGNLRLGEDGKIYLLDFEYAGLNIRQGVCYDLGTILGGNLFDKKPIEVKTFIEIFKKAEVVYKTKFDKRKMYYGALINVLVMFRWGLIKYFSSNKKSEIRYFKEYVLKRAKGAESVYRIIKRN